MMCFQWHGVGCHVTKNYNCELLKNKVKNGMNNYSPFYRFHQYWLGIRGWRHAIIQGVVRRGDMANYSLEFRREKIHDIVGCWLKLSWKC